MLRQSRTEDKTAAVRMMRTAAFFANIGKYGMGFVTGQDTKTGGHCRTFAFRRRPSA